MAKDFSKIVESSIEAVKKVYTWLSDVFTRYARKKLTIQTEVKGGEKVEEVKRKIESLPKTQTVEVNVEKRGDPSNSGLTGMNPDKTAIEAPQVTKWSKLKGVFNSLRSGVSKFAEGLKEASKVFVSTGGGVLILYEGIKSLIQIGQHFYNTWIDGMKRRASWGTLF